MSPFFAFDLSIEFIRLLSELHWRSRNADPYRRAAEEQVAQEVDHVAEADLAGAVRVEELGVARAREVAGARQVLAAEKEVAEHRHRVAQVERAVPVHVAVRVQPLESRSKM